MARRSYSKAIAIYACGLTLGLTLACSSASFDGHRYRSNSVSFQLAHIPSDWHLLESDAALLAFRDERSASTIAVNGRCGKDADDVPLQSLTQHLFLQFTERQVGEQQTLSLDGREALLSELQAKLDGVNKHFIVVVLKKDGCVYDFLYVSDAPPQASAALAFEGFVRGFSTLD